MRQEIRARESSASRVYRAVVIGLVIFIVGRGDGGDGIVSLIGLIGLMGLMGLMRALGLVKIIGPAGVLCPYARVGSLGGRDG